MPLTKEDRILLLAKARQAKKDKADAKKAEKIANPPPKGRPKKVVEETKTLELELPVEPTPEPVEPVEPEVEIIEEIIYEPKIKKKKKKKIVRKIVRQQESSSESEQEVEEQIVYEKPKKSYQKPPPIKIERQREVDITQSTPQFNFFGD